MTELSGAEIDTGAVSALEIAIRRLAPDERRDTGHDAVRMALHSWIQQAAKDMGSGQGWQGGVERSRYWDRQHDLCARLLAEDSLAIATPPDAPDLYFGWVCWSPKAHALHFVYVKAAYRGFGVARALLKHAAPLEHYTHRPDKRTRHWLSTHGLTYDPYALML